MRTRSYTLLVPSSSSNFSVAEGKEGRMRQGDRGLGVVVGNRANSSVRWGSEWAVPAIYLWAAHTRTGFLVPYSVGDEVQAWEILTDAVVVHSFGP